MDPSRKRKKTTKQPKANSKKKRRQSRSEELEVEEEGRSVAGEDVQGAQEELATDPPTDDAAEAQEEARLEEERLTQERRRKIREEEPEMFDEYAMSEDSVPLAEALRNGVVERRDEDGQADVVDEDAEEEAATPAEDVEDVDDQQQEATDDQQVEKPAAGADVDMEAGRDARAESEDLVRNDEDAAVEETPAPRRKRTHRESASPEQPRKEKSRKKQKKTKDIVSGDLGEYGAVDQFVPKATVVRQAGSSRSRQSNMESYTQPLAKGSELRHPVYNPESPEHGRRKHRIEVVVPMSSAGPSNSKHTTAMSALLGSADGSALKRRLKGPLSSPIRTTREDEWNVRNQPEEHLQNGLAKSTARRTFDEESENTSDQDYEAAEPEASDAEPKRKKKSKKGKEPAQSSKSRSSTPAGQGGYQFRCPICNGKFKTEKSLQKHRDDPVAHEHLLDCAKCDEQFASRAGLARHEKEKGHGSGSGQVGKTGAFTTDERNEVERWKELFCNEHEINSWEFNEMMTASGKSGTSGWPYKFITKRGFQLEYYESLPGRNIRSMRRFRANFSNLDTSRDFTAQDDEDIILLVAQLGQKWTDIGDQLTRDPEILRQRWKNKLQFQKQGQKLKDGVWEDDEARRFEKALKEIRRNTIAGSTQDVDSFNWTAMSIKVKTRTPQQCANHWRAMHGKSVKGLWIDSGLSQILNPKKKSAMERRLTGFKSKERVHDSDGEEENEEVSDENENDDAEDPESEEQQDEAAHGEDEAASEHESGAAVQTKTPRRKSRKPKIHQHQTPVNGISVSQAFQQTQAHTSAVKKSAKRGRQSTPSQEQPTPGIAVQARPERSPEFGKRLEEVLDEAEAEPEVDAADEAPETEEQRPDDLEAASDDEHDNASPHSADEEGETQDPLLLDEAAEAYEEDEDDVTQRGDQADVPDTNLEGDVVELPNGQGLDQHEKPQPAAAARDQESDADSIVQIFRNAASPSKRKLYKSRSRPQTLTSSARKKMQWPEESDPE
jgi:uncharacterized C2H2 Zn-finger protein